MNLKEAKAIINKKSININLHYFIIKFNDGYAISDSNFMKRFPYIKYVYSTGSLNQEWIYKYSGFDKKPIHYLKKLK